MNVQFAELLFWPVSKLPSLITQQISYAFLRAPNALCVVFRSPLAQAGPIYDSRILMSVLGDRVDRQAVV
jgi:hypothetical protein